MAKTFQVDTGGTLTTNLVAYYPLSDANDFWSTNNLTNNGSVTFSTGKVGNAADGGSANTTKSLTISNSLSYTGSSYSIALWFNVTTTPSALKYIATVRDSTTKTVLQLNYNGTVIGFDRSRNGVADDQVSYTVTPTTGTWHHLVITYNGSQVEGWYDGVSRGTQASTGNGTAGTGAYFGILKDVNSGGYFSGLVDEVGLWNKKLSNTEIADLYNSGTGQTMVDSGGGGATTKTLAALGVG